MPSIITNPNMPASNSTLSKRRRFQAPITSFFPSASAASESADGHTVSHNHYSASTFSATPVVPAKVQASLLSVGMRVRKSVADGYKTQLSLNAEKAKIAVVASEPRLAQPYYGNNSYAELPPFSGFSKSANDPYSVNTDDGDAFSLPPSSQESITSTASYASTNGHKRSFDFGNDVYAYKDSGNEAPRGRTILSPRRRLLTQNTSNLPKMDLDDFEEASFLRQREEVDSDYLRMDCA
ncbi:uncharacterized protein N7473_010410 [Penicillium subrubescens]|uniref:Uncharacterized protein n=1 Tax=Penicillium subrubescens TaxID=1316194 RepID=A0A1Q5SZ63_9EURO|nr:uncharacterized protein N7473_010410 [Penicillium subrubescens]KAJ5883524.1 hypothetical protein N7473_010410 [Penicillium subrubescens]OKO93274.1 hypothetical protein PENSUB_12337 [Penicillium subrubescens]